VGGKPLIVWHLEKLAAIGVRDVVINTSWLAEQFPATLGDGSRWGLRLHYSYEGAEPLETGGGMLHALHLLSEEDDSHAPFLAINGDIWTDFDFALLPRAPREVAHLVMTPNPDHNARGDFSLSEDGIVHSDGAKKQTFAGIGVYRRDVFTIWRLIIGDAPGANEVPPRFKLAPLLRAAMRGGAVTGELHRGAWTDVGTPERLAELDSMLRTQL